MSDLIAPELDVLPKLLIELRDDDAVAAITDRIRIREPAPPVLHPQTREVIDEGDGRGPGRWVPFVVLVRLSGPPHRGIPVTTVRVGVRCYGADSRQAAVLRAACAAALHHREPRVHSNGLVIYASHDISGGAQVTDPDTRQPVETFVVEAVASTQVLTA